MYSITANTRSLFIKIICILLLLVVCLACLRSPIRIHAAGYITRSFTVTNSDTFSTANSQSELVVNTTTEITAGRIRSDCGDMRIYDATFRTAIVYMLFNCNTTFTSIIFAGVLAAGATNTYYLTYGDPNLTSASNPAGVVSRYEMWTAAPTCTLAGGAAWSAVNNWLVLTTATANKLGTCNYVNDVGGAGFRVWMEAYAGTVAAGSTAIWQYAFTGTLPTQEDVTANASTHFTLDEAAGRACYTTSVVADGACTASFATTTLANSTFYDVRLTLGSATGTGPKKLSINGVERVNTTAGTAPNVAGANINFGFAARTGTANPNEHRIRQYVQCAYNALITVSALSASTAPVDTVGFALRNDTDSANYNLICDLGDLIVSTIATCAYRLKIFSNARNGYTVSVTTSGNFKNGTANAMANAVVGSSTGAGTNMVAGTETYGVDVIQNNCTNGTGTSANIFKDLGANYAVLLNYSTPQVVYTCNGPNQPAATDLPNTALITHKVTISGDTAAGNYAQSVTWTVAPNY